MNVHQMQLSRKSRAALGWCLLTFVATQVAFNVVLDYWPEIRDPEYGFKFAALRTRLRESSAQQLMLLFGSSRTSVGINPKAVREVLSDAKTPALVFNFGMTGAGPVQHLMLLRKLLANEIRPKQLFVEVHPCFLDQLRGAMREEFRIDPHRLDWRELGVLCEFSEDPKSLLFNWLRSRSLPCYAYRNKFLECYLPTWCGATGQYRGHSGVGPLGWLPFPIADRSDAARHNRTEYAHWEYQHQFKVFDITTEPDRALRELLAICSEERIRVNFYLMPEGSEFRSWYPPGAFALVSDYLNCLQREYGCGLYDLSTAMDDESFADSHHLLPEAVGAFSTRFARDVVVPTLKHDYPLIGAERLVDGLDKTSSWQKQR